MKKCLIMLLAAALFVVAGCKKDDNNAKKMTFTSDFGGGAKTEINNHSMKWTTGDDININGETFACEIKDNGNRAEFTGKVVESPYNAYYPTSIWSEGKTILPSTQHYDGTNLSGVSPMYANSTNTTLVFHNICVLVKLDLKGIGTVKTITASADQPLSGGFTIEGNEDEGYYAKVPQLRDGAATVTLDCGQGEALDATTHKAFYIALPKGEYTNLKFTVSNGSITKEVTLEDNNLVAGKLYEIAKEIELVPGALSGKFTVNSDGKQVYFSRGNLWCDNSTPAAPVWYFEDNQYDFHTFGTTENGMVHDGVVSDNTENTWGLFAWSCVNHPYGMLTESASSGFDDVFVDWGNNPISNGGNNASQYKWRTLEAGQTDGGEWQYLLESRDGNRYAYAQVCGVNGLVIFPDGWDSSSSSSTHTFSYINMNNKQYHNNTIGASDWGKLHEEGCVFLPTVGRKNGSGIWEESNEGRYWANGISNKKNESQSLHFATNAWNPGKNSERKYGYSVRLVMDVPASNN